MKTQRFAFFLSLCWMIGMVAVFSFPPKIIIESEGKSSQTFLKEVSGPDLHLRTTFENLKTPPFEVDWRLSAKLNSEWIPEFFSTSVVYLAPSFFQKSRALLDIKQFFIRFFYSW
ncbi:hypothetical protein [Algoriphagus sp. AK58]|uniref:hypothetical protein n=1 Tax=Algoriphagus sp. AK58 TaxID=1406877 RepID=UPI001650AD6B|nr:hypothetical protein [Algoriphagus sp. AK58]MBC6367852.1 hypothetical protein [Algoriphagus sp. AK58]